MIPVIRRRLASAAAATTVESTTASTVESAASVSVPNWRMLPTERTSAIAIAATVSIAAMVVAAAESVTRIDEPSAIQVIRRVESIAERAPEETVAGQQSVAVEAPDRAKPA